MCQVSSHVSELEITHKGCLLSVHKQPHHFNIGLNATRKLLDPLSQHKHILCAEAIKSCKKLQSGKLIKICVSNLIIDRFV